MPSTPGPDRSRRWLAAQEWPIQLALALALASGLALAFLDHSVFWPDEIYQSLEPAHRLVFGYGLMPWEFRDGARSWVFPGLLALPLEALKLLGARSGLTLVVAARCLVVLLVTLGVASGIEYARRLGGKAAALLAAFSLALFPPSLVYSHRTLQEIVSAPLVSVVPLLLLTRRRSTAAWAGAAIALATLLRFQCAIVAAVFFVALAVERRWAELRAYTASGAGLILLGGALDWATWGHPFHSVRAYVEFNLVRNGASTFGVSPADYYLRTLWTASGPALALIAIGLVAGARRAPAATVAALGFIALHSLVPHKELRFVLPVLPLALSVAAVGLARVAEHWATRRFVLPALTLLLSLGFARRAYSARYADYGQYEGTRRASEPVFGAEQEVNLLLADAGQQPDLCGLLVLGQRAAFTGAYSYLHRNVPLLYRYAMCQEATSANYVIADRSDTSVPEQFQLVRQRGNLGLLRRDGACGSPPPDYSDLLEGAEDMGLGRGPIEQPNPHELDIEAGASAAAFVSGFGHGERQGCRRVRWAVGTTSHMAFQLAPADASYAFELSAEPFIRTVPQSMRVLLNDQPLAEYDLAPGRHDYRAPVPQAMLLRGRNRLDFTFAHAERPGDDDDRLLAALFERVKLAPVDLAVRVGFTKADDEHNARMGFARGEVDSSGPFAWSDGEYSELTVAVPEAFDASVLLITASAFAPLAPVTVNVTLNHEPAGAFLAAEESSRSSLLLPANLLHRGDNTLRLAYSAVAKPSDHEPGSSDRRALSVMYRGLVVAPLPWGLHADFGTEAAERMQAYGFSAATVQDGHTVVESEGRESKLWFRADAPAAATCTLGLDLAAFPAAVPLGVELSINGRSLGKVSAGAEWQHATLPVPSGVLAPGTSSLELAYDHTVPEPSTLSGPERALRIDAIHLDCGERGKPAR